MARRAIGPKALSPRGPKGHWAEGPGAAKGRVARRAIAPKVHARPEVAWPEGPLGRRPTRGRRPRGPKGLESVCSTFDSSVSQLTCQPSKNQLASQVPDDQAESPRAAEGRVARRAAGPKAHTRPKAAMGRRPIRGRRRRGPKSLGSVCSTFDSSVSHLICQPGKNQLARQESDDQARIIRQDVFESPVAEGHTGPKAQTRPKAAMGRSFKE